MTHKEPVKPVPQEGTIIQEHIHTAEQPPEPLVEAEQATEVADAQLPIGPVTTRFGDRNAPRFLRRVVPKYPPVARRRGREGQVLLELTIDEHGSLLDVGVLKTTTAAFARAAVKAIKKSRFAAARQDGRAVPAKALLPIQFTLHR